MLLQACLGIEVDGERREVHALRPMLPVGVEWLTINDLAINGSKIDLRFQRLGEEIVVMPSGHAPQGIRVLAHL